MTTYATLIGQIVDVPGDKYTCFQKGLPPKPYKVLVPRGTYQININFYAAIDYLVGYVARTQGPPAMDYSGMRGITADQWNGCAWMRDAYGTLEAAENVDWQVRNRGGHGTVIQQVYLGGSPTDEWLYLLPVVGTGVIREIEVLFQILKNKWQGWNPGYASVVTYPPGGKFYTGEQAPIPTPTPSPNPFPFPLPIPGPAPAPTFAAKKGDIIFQVTERVNPGEPGALQQYYKAFFQEILWASGVYEGFYNQYTYDDTDGYFGDGVPRYWFHCEIATEDLKTLPVKAGVRYVVCRLTTEMQKAVDVLMAANMYKVISSGPDFRYGQPFVAAFLKWVQTLAPGHFDGLPILRDRIREMFGIDIESYDFKRYQYSPTVSDLAYTDLHDDEFWDRDFDCSSLTLWVLVHGWNVKTNGQVRPMFLGQYQYVAAVDCVAPGLLAAWLIENGMADVI